MEVGLNQTTINGTDTNSLEELYSFLLTIHPIGLGVIFTTINWLLTTLGAAACFFFICCSRKSNKFYNTLLESLFGLGGGVMLAASFFSLLLPAAELSEKQYGEYIYVLPVFGGFAIGILFFIVFDIGVDYLNDFVDRKKKQYDRELQKLQEQESAAVEPIMSTESMTEVPSVSSIELKDNNTSAEVKIEEKLPPPPSVSSFRRKPNWKSRLSTLLVKFRRSFLLMLSMTIHNLPEGIVVGVAFGSIASDTNKNGISISNAVSLSLGVGIQNIPEGLSVSLPLVRDGAGYWKSFLIGSASATVEILGGLIGSGLVSISESILPYALSFSSACMIFVVVSELIPETITKHNHDDETEPKSDLVAASKLEEGTLNSSQFVTEKTPDILVPRKKHRFYKLTSRIGLAGFFIGFMIMMILDLIL